MRRIVVLHGTSGVSLTRCAEKIKSSLSSLIPVEHDDLEERIKSQHSFQRMTEAVWQAPRDVMTSSVWPKAAREGISQLLSSHADLGILTCHLTYYRGQTHEFYEPGDLFQIYQDEWSRQPNNADASAPPLCVVTLIDDLYDVFLRLSAKEEVFDIQGAISYEYRRREKDKRESENPDSQYVLAFEQVTAIMLRILDWRSREISAGDSLARRANGRSFVLAIKHPIQTARDLILSECDFRSTRFYNAYLSHPISRPRRHQKKHQTEDWPDFVRHFHTFVRIVADTELDGKKVLLFMPAAIDELRIADHEHKSFPTLHRRWPLISEDRNAILYEFPQDYRSYDDFEKDVLLESIFNPLGSARKVELSGRENLTRYAQSAQGVATRLSDYAKREVNGLLGSLRQQIRAQIALRDHTFVRQCGRFLLYRPLFGEGVISGGVGAELKNWEGIAKQSLEFRRRQQTIPWPWGPAVFLHDEKDPPPLDEAKVILNVAYRLRTKFAHFNLEVKGDTFEDWVRKAPPVPDELLGGGPSPQELRSFQESAKRFYDEERRRAEHDVLTAGRGPEELRLAVVVKDLENMPDDALRRVLETQVMPALINSQWQRSTEPRSES